MKNGYFITKFVGIESPTSVDAKGLTSAIFNCIKSFNQSDQDPEENLESDFKRSVNVNFDSASVMSGHVSGVQIQLKKRRDGLPYTHCVAHLLDLAVLDAMKFEDTYLEKFNDTLMEYLDTITILLLDAMNLNPSQTCLKKKLRNLVF